VCSKFEVDITKFCLGAVPKIATGYFFYAFFCDKFIHFSLNFTNHLADMEP